MASSWSGEIRSEMTFSWPVRVLFRRTTQENLISTRYNVEKEKTDTKNASVIGKGRETANLGSYHPE